MTQSNAYHQDNPTVDRVRPQARARQRAVILVNTGSPEHPDAESVRRYLAEFLSDPLVIQLPAGLGWLQSALGHTIARFRAAHSSKLYSTIWTDQGSPLVATMQRIASELESSLPKGWKVFSAMRYGQPSIMETMATIRELGIEEIVVVPMFPQFSCATSGSVIRETYRALREVGEHLSVTTRAAWYDDIGYINAQVGFLADYVQANGLTPENSYLLFSAHGLPVSYIKRGDPYRRHIQRTVELLTERLGWPTDRLSLSFQSRLGPSRWLEPDTEVRLAELADSGENQVVVCPISFTVDCLETLEEIGVRYREKFELKGGRLWLCPCLNTHESIISALKSLVLRGPQPITSWGSDFVPLMATEPKEEKATDGDLKSLVMIGASLPNRVGPGRGPRMHHTEAADLCCVKKSHEEVHAFLEQIRKEGNFTEAFVWNTCHRYEFYGWLKNPEDVADRECVIGRTWHQLFGAHPDGLGVNVLFGADAWRHHMRTVAGLNSGLPGDRDVSEQLRTACRLAGHAGTAGPRSYNLVEQAMSSERELRQETAWGQYHPGYCLAAFHQIRRAAGLEPADCRYAVIGGSTTSRAVLEMLADEFGVSKRQMTIIYRGHKGGQMKLLRSAIGNGRRVRVHAYSERAVIDNLADADVVFIGTDRNEPILKAEALRGVRDFDQHPLTVIDFNTLGSTRGLETIDGVTLWKADRLEHEVDAYADTICVQKGFICAVQEADEWIEKRVPVVSPPYPELPCKGGVRSTPSECAHCKRNRCGGTADVEGAV